MRDIGNVRISQQGLQELLTIDMRHIKRAEGKAYDECLFSLIQCNAQYFRQFFRYFKQGMGDFGPHQTIPVLMSLSPFPPSTQEILAPPRMAI
jgi:hypothetical protein